MQHVRLDQRLFLISNLKFPLRPRGRAGAKGLLRRYQMMPYLQSVAIEAVAYDEKAHLLKARFRADGKVMIYENVPPEIYDSLIFAESIGGFFRSHIEGAYPAHEVPRTQGRKPSRRSSS